MPVCSLHEYSFSCLCCVSAAGRLASLPRFASCCVISRITRTLLVLYAIFGFLYFLMYAVCTRVSNYEYNVHKGIKHLYIYLYPYCEYSYWEYCRLCFRVCWRLPDLVIFS